jgi:hypothetical protein
MRFAANGGHAGDSPCEREELTMPMKTFVNLP